MVKHSFIAVFKMNNSVSEKCSMKISVNVRNININTLSTVQYSSAVNELVGSLTPTALLLLAIVCCVMLLLHALCCH
jgi:hypothetical protein